MDLSNQTTTDTKFLPLYPGELRNKTPSLFSTTVQDETAQAP